MKPCLLGLALLFAAAPALSQDYLPRDVQRYVDRREGCDQLRGERDRDRVNEVSRELRRLCGGMDRELLQLKKKYAGNSTIRQILDQFEAGIEMVETTEAPVLTPAPALKNRKLKRAG